MTSARWALTAGGRGWCRWMLSPSETWKDNSAVDISPQAAQGKVDSSSSLDFSVRFPLSLVGRVLHSVCAFWYFPRMCFSVSKRCVLLFPATWVFLSLCISLCLSVSASVSLPFCWPHSLSLSVHRSYSSICGVSLMRLKAIWMDKKTTCLICLAQLSS